MIQIQLQDAVVEHTEMQVPTEAGTTEVRHMLSFIDKLTGIRIALIFTPEELEITEKGDLVLKKQSPADLLLARADQMPPEPPDGKGPAQPPRQAGPGRPGR